MTVYAQVEDIPETLKKAESLGGSTVIAETEVPDQGSFAWFKDLDQNIVGLWKPFKR